MMMHWFYTCLSRGNGSTSDWYFAPQQQWICCVGSQMNGCYMQACATCGELGHFLASGTKISSALNFVKWPSDKTFEKNWKNHRNEAINTDQETSAAVDTWDPTAGGLLITKLIVNYYKRYYGWL